MRDAYCNCSGIGYNGDFCENDINECSKNNGGCHVNADCTNTPGSFSCSCKSGYFGDGLRCKGKKKIFFFFWSKSIYFFLTSNRYR